MRRDLPNSDTFLRLYNSNMWVEGTGFDMTIHMPCPFCAEANWMVHNFWDAREVMTQDHYCSKCERTATILLKATQLGVTECEIVQVDGPPAPLWLKPAPRRVARER